MWNQVIINALPWLKNFPLCLRNSYATERQREREAGTAECFWDEWFVRLPAAARATPALDPDQAGVLSRAPDMKEEVKKEKKEKRVEKEAKKGEKKDKVKKISTVSVTPKKTRTWSELMTAESFRSSSLLVSLTLVIVLSTVLLVIVAILVGSFRISLFTMASSNFLAGPIMMVIASTLGILLAVFGFILVFKRHFNLYIGLAACSLVAFMLQMVAVVLAFLLRDNIDSDFNKVVVDQQEW